MFKKPCSAQRRAENCQVEALESRSYCTVGIELSPISAVKPSPHSAIETPIIRVGIRPANATSLSFFLALQPSLDSAATRLPDSAVSGLNLNTGRGLKSGRMEKIEIALPNVMDGTYFLLVKAVGSDGSTSVTVSGQISVITVTSLGARAIATRQRGTVEVFNTSGAFFTGRVDVRAFVQDADGTAEAVLEDRLVFLSLKPGAAKAAPIHFRLPSLSSGQSLAASAFVTANRQQVSIV